MQSDILLGDITDDPRWVALATKASGTVEPFFYSVSTTGVYCRSTCAARLAKPEHVRFHDTGEDAEEAGFRPCKRCKPDQAALEQRHATAVEKACRLMEHSEQTLSLATLASAAGMSPHHFHRVFKRLTGVTPHRFACALRAGRLQRLLQESSSVTEAMYAAGFASSAAFHVASGKVMGMTPSAFRAGGAAQVLQISEAESSLGHVLVAQSARGVCAILLGDDRDRLLLDLRARFPEAELRESGDEMQENLARIVELVEHPEARTHLALDLRGTAFQQRVWQALCTIGPGETISYSALAQNIGAPKSTRAVAQACAANHVAVAVPCHRVLCSDGALAGYRWGTHRKRILLERERKP